MFTIVSYDITSDRRRVKIANILKDYGERVQYSVFECIIDNEILERMVKRLLKTIDGGEDSLRIYKLCKDCKKKIDVYGTAHVTEDKEVYIV
ncbi:CRISPR-associated endonuclease Cas2 [candidate division WOR-3 bacterium JGI_Cruoil_03_44_89]|uniref:CRISPR-associated endoribonuclease Cas2 n=1 Tax=candidate division WOR-3 bacterium JGI_Cruoil_03_44_89 TaxID=1973748 RepID=A0A235BNT9_UNCW3|nr:MAG: CRISPR-associated endonuclease Cas2 [candidate division WOR-3 bacterium JGI_Cruoil_03_44_89]